MPLPLLPLIGAGVGLLGQGINAITNSSANRQDRDFQREMYNRQRQDSLADWAMQNSYNSPRAQMERLADAGLNPNLVYGSGATATSAPVRSAGTSSVRTQPAQFDLGSVLAQFMNLQMIQAQTDNVRAQKDERIASAALKREQSQLAEAMGTRTYADAERLKYNLDFERMMQSNSIERRDADLRKTRADIDYTVHADRRADIAQGMEQQRMRMSFMEIAQRIEESKARIGLTRSQEALAIQNVMNQPLVRQMLTANITARTLDGAFRQIEVDMAKQGYFKSDPIYQRTLQQAGDAANMVNGIVDKVLGALKKR